MPAIKPINLVVALEPTSGPVVLVDHCLGVGCGGFGVDRHFELSFNDLSHTHTHTHTTREMSRMMRRYTHTSTHPLVSGPYGPDVSRFCCVVSFCYK